MAACSFPNMQAAPQSSAEEVIGAVVIQSYPALSPAPVANCIARNATLQERRDLTAKGAGPSSAKTLDIVRAISARALTQTCFAEQGVTPEPLG